MELTIDEELEQMTRQMCSVRKPKETPIEESPVQETKEPCVVDKREKSRQKDARRKSKQGR